MYGTVKMGSKEVGMVANAASPYIYKQVFHEDFLSKLQAKEPDTDLFQKMAYIMAKQAEIEKLPELMKLTEEGFYEWLLQFESMDVLYAIEEIANLYLAQKKETAVPKNEGE